MLETIKTWLVVLAAVSAVACSGPVVERRDLPAPVERGGQSELGSPRESDLGSAEISAYVAPAQPRVARPTPAKAVQVLSQRADEQARRGDQAAAVASLERALRIAPRNATLWHRLARVRADQGRHTMAEELARKSNSLAATYDRDLKRNNWLLIADARRARGNVSGAREAERQASRFD